MSSISISESTQSQEDIQLPSLKPFDGPLIEPLKTSQEAASIQDILTCICQHLRFYIDDPPDIRSEARVSLLSAALSFRTMREPALNALWHTLPSITPLLSLLPFVSYNSGEYRFVTGKIAWTRLEHHAIRVRAVVLENDPQERSISSTLLSYLDNTHKKPLLPGIHTFQIPFGVDFNKSSVFSMISSDSLKVLKISTSSDSDTEFSVSLLHYAQAMCPGLSQVEITDGKSSDILPPIGQMKLHRLSLHIPQAILPYSIFTTKLDLNSSLKHLKIVAASVKSPTRNKKGDNKGKTTNSSTNSARRPFRNLISLELRGNMAPVLDWIFARAVSLTHLSMNVNSFSGLVGLRGLPSLICLQIHDGMGSNMPLFDLTRFMSADFAPAIEQIIFAPDIIVSTLTDLNLEHMATSWPRLKTVKFPLYINDGACPTTDGLISLATHCSDLEVLSLPLQFILAPTSTTTARSNLKHLLINTGGDPGPPLLSSTISLARTFYRYFPKLKTFNTYGPCSENTTETCKSIQELLYFLRDVST
ncbi:hypothetical protein BJ165DRAFT_1408962 [Panaeolus papilionaceus]|nr:hypothetical protein BJ165DRAFT_1408962 [Panaeolus papilionaceus]